MTIFVLGVNHKSANLTLREQVVVAPERLSSTLQALKNQLDLKEVVIISTCNRTEIYASMPHDSTGEDLTRWFVRHSGWSESQVARLSYLHRGAPAVRHALRVASGLDSLVLGEPQILGQIKTAYASARQARTLGGELSQLFQYVFKCAKNVRSQTRIGASPVSVAYAAVNLSKRIFSSLPGANVLLVGAGQTAELVARHFKSAGVKHILCANRTVERARRLARVVSGEAIVLQQIPQYLSQADILVCSTASPLPIIGKGMMEEAIRQRRHRPVLAIDLAVPRDIESAVGEMEDIFLYTVDDLEAVISDNVRQRSLAAEVAEQLVHRQSEAFLALQRERNAVSRLCLYRSQIDSIRKAELGRALQALRRGADPDQVLERFSHAFMNKVTHVPTVQLRHIAAEGDSKGLLDAERILGLNQALIPSTHVNNEAHDWQQADEPMMIESDRLAEGSNGESEPGVGKDQVRVVPGHSFGNNKEPDA